MKYKEHIHNSSVVLNSEWSCTINCPWCSFAVKERKETNILPIEEVKRRIDFVSDKLLSNKDWTCLILLPWNVLLEYDSDDLEEILLYACSKHERVQWELEQIDEKILEIFSNDVIVELLSKQRFFLNVWYIDGNLELLKKIFHELSKIWWNNIKNILIEKWIYNDFKNKDVEDKFKILKWFREEWKVLPKPINLLKFTVHFDKDKVWELKNFIDYLWVNINLNDFEKLEDHWWDIHYDIFSAGILFSIHSTINQKIDKNWDNIWDVEHIKWYEECILLNTDFEWSLWGDKEWTILPHINPCINEISFWNLESNEFEIEENFKKHREKIFSILLKNRYKKNFDQSELCRMCLDWEEGEELKILDYIKYVVRQQVFITKENYKSIFWK